MPEKIYNLETQLSVNEIAQIFRSSLSQSCRNVEFGRIDDFDNPFAEMDRVDFSAWASEKAMLPRNNFALQIYVDDVGSARLVTIVALGTGFVDQMFIGGKSNQLGAAKKKSQVIIDSLRSEDSGLRIISG